MSDDDPKEQSERGISYRELLKSKRRRNYLLGKKARQEMAERAKEKKQAQARAARETKDREMWARLTTAAKIKSRKKEDED